jgi:hypothetical protein
MKLYLIILALMVIPAVLAFDPIEATVKNKVNGHAEFEVSWVASERGFGGFGEGKDIYCAGENKVIFKEQGEEKKVSCEMAKLSDALQDRATYQIKVCLKRDGVKSCEVAIDNYVYESECSGKDKDTCLFSGKCAFKDNGPFGIECKPCSELGLSKCEDFSGQYIDSCLQNFCTDKRCMRKGNLCITDCEYDDDGNSAICKKPKLTLTFVPINWKGTNEEYYDRVDYYMEKVYTEFPLSACKERINTIVFNTNANIEFDFMASGSNREERKTATAYALYDSLEGLGVQDRYDYAIGIYGEGIDGMSGFVEASQIILAYNKSCELDSRFTLAHELGHKFGLNEEYLDVVRCDFNVINPSANKLKKELGGNLPSRKGSKEFCAEGDKCPKYDENNNLQECKLDTLGEYSICNTWTKSMGLCEGNHLDAENKERCIMSGSDNDERIKSGASKKTGFCQECKNFLKIVPELDCSTDD